MCLLFFSMHLLVHSSMQQSLTVLVPRVWPFLRHTISSVRRAALETLYTLLYKADQVKLTKNKRKTLDSFFSQNNRCIKILLKQYNVFYLLFYIHKKVLFFLVLIFNAS